MRGFSHLIQMMGLKLWAHCWINLIWIWSGGAGICRHCLEIPTPSYRSIYTVSDVAASGDIRGWECSVRVNSLAAEFWTYWSLSKSLLGIPNTALLQNGWELQTGSDDWIRCFGDRFGMWMKMWNPEHHPGVTLLGMEKCANHQLQ